MKFLSIVVLVAFPASVCAEDFDLTKLGKSQPLKAQAGPTVQVAQAAPEIKVDCSSGACKVVTGVGDGNNTTQVVVQPNAVVVKQQATVAPTRYWGVVGYQRTGWFGRRPVYGWVSTSGTVVRSTTVRSSSSCSSGRCVGRR
jgi:hypothetical protein